jgi:hypothetical protein
MGVKEDKEVDAGNRSWAMPTQSRIGEKREGPPSYLASSLLHCWAWASYSPPSPWPLPRRLQDRRAGRRRQRWVWFEGCDGTGRDTLVQRRIRSPDTGRIDSPRSNGQERPISPSRTMWGAPATPVTAHPKSLTSHLLLVHSRPAHLELDLGGDVPVRVRLSFGARRSAPAAFSVLLRNSFSVSVGRDWLMKFAPPSPPAAGRYFIWLCWALSSNGPAWFIWARVARSRKRIDYVAYGPSIQQGICSSPLIQPNLAAAVSAYPRGTRRICFWIIGFDQGYAMWRMQS